ncbi:NCS1 family nucleobase:cation symporter-1 [Microbacterium capsulatum]|uniref:NCS1 family nucleobase:cation symporter-1 n=1 Tax=Microbacterium capsulatum TaxID=3041921 RepID=A0ABU0XK80_9MICO|nr:NCS1 family nucleobase:cation symporter-1 [Microbacterium sp. ASV81]MDQ4215533.1 NCS1 family nucleobase:cation symporter-1 [Microbacterium sp. ASV81]
MTDQFVHDVSNEELHAQDPDGRLYNEDLAPAQPSHRKWNAYQLFSLWMNDAHNAGNYTWAAGLFVGLGMSAFDVTLGIFLGSIIILIGCTLSGFMGHATGTPYPVISRITWGVWGANIPALVRGVVAIAWYGVQTYLASIALNALLSRAIPAFRDLSTTSAPSILGLSVGGWICFLILSLIQLIIVRNGMEAVRHFQGLAGPIIWIVMLTLMFYFLGKAGWGFDWFSGPKGQTVTGGAQARNILIAMAQTVGTLATLMLNFADFARYSPSRKAVVVGNLWGLPINWTAFAVTSVITTAAAAKVLHADMNEIKDPGILISHVDNSVMFYIFTGAFVFATIGVNIVANFVSAAFDISNVNPKRISFRTGGLITAIAAIVVTPWNYFNNPIVVGYFLGSLGALLGPFFGILIVDFFLVRKQKFSIRHMYLPSPKSIYYYNKGVSRYALYALIPSAIVALSIALVPWFAAIQDFGWFIGAPLAGIIYYLIANNRVIVLPHDTAEESEPATA